MIRITVCDDERGMLNQYEKMLQRYAEEYSTEIQAEYIQNPDLLMEDELSEQDILILDIQMGEKNGVEIARKIRQNNERLILFFSTNYLEYALEGYEVRAFRYLKKPISYEFFAKDLRAAIQELQKRESAVLTLRCGYALQRFPIADITYCETESSHLRIHLVDGTSYLANVGIAKLEEQTAAYDFCRCHRAYLINLFYVAGQHGNDITMRDGTLIPISKYRVKEVMEVLLKYWGSQLV